MKRVLAIWLPNWPIQRLLNEQPQLQGRPVILAAPGRRGQSVAACSREAYETGIRLGMPMGEAIALLPGEAARAKGASSSRASLPKRESFLRSYDPAADRRALERLAQWCHRYSPTVGVEEGESSETLLLDATNLALLYGSERQLVVQVMEGVRRLGLRARTGLGATIGAAWALAHYGENDADEPIVPTDQTRAVLALFPIAALRLPDDLLESLRHLGVERVENLLALPREQLQSRFGTLLLTRLDQALGLAREVFAAVEPPEDFVVQQLFETPLSEREALYQIVAALVERLAWMLAARCAGAVRVVCRFDCEGAPPAEFEVNLFQPSASPRQLLEIVELEMERFRLPGAATAISVQAVGHAPLLERQGELFDEKRDLENSARLAALVNRLAGRLGREAVVRCRLQPEVQPELGYLEEPLVDGTGGSKRKAQRPSSKRAAARPAARGALDRPLYLLRKPAALDAVSVVPDGPPLQFRRGGRCHVVARHWGPERIETGWWRGQSAGRDYYRVETDEGYRYWLFRRRRDGRWFLHGSFG